MDEGWYNVTPLVKENFVNQFIKQFIDAIFTNLFGFFIEITLYR